MWLVFILEWNVFNMYANAYVYCYCVLFSTLALSPKSNDICNYLKSFDFFISRHTFFYHRKSVFLSPHFSSLLLLFFHYLCCFILWFQFISRLHYLYMYLGSFHTYNYIDTVGTLFFIHSSYKIKSVRMCCMWNCTSTFIKHWMNEQIVVHKISFRLANEHNNRIEWMYMVNDFRYEIQVNRYNML